MNSIKLNLILLCFFAITLAYAQNIPYTCGTPTNPITIPALPISKGNQDCDNDFTEFLEKHADDLIPLNGNQTLKIRTNVIFAQNADGRGNFSLSDPKHVEFWNKVFVDLNQRLANLLNNGTCECSTNPIHYNNIHIEFVPNFIEVKDNFAWDHNNDAQTNVENSFDKDYLNYINNLASQTPGYLDGFNAIITTDATDFNNYTGNNPSNLPLWNLNYIQNYDGHWYSSFPTFNLNHPAMWHAPDAYLWYINGFDHLGGDWYIDTQYRPWVVGIFLHEYGHYFNLFHTVSGCQGNIMTSGAGSYTSFTGCQARDAYMTLMTKNLRKYVICDDVFDHSLVVDSDETWKLNMRLYSNVVVKSGATLKITCEVNMAPNGKIVVERGGKLIIDGGTITCEGTCSNQLWRGILVEGNSGKLQPSLTAILAPDDAGVVIVKNNALIENAATAISTSSDKPWPLATEYWGGVIVAENSRFINNRRAIEFMSYRFPNVSKFQDCTFKEDGDKYDNTIGVTIWSCHDIAFNSNTFETLDLSGVMGIDFDATFTQNKFSKLFYGIESYSTHPYVSSMNIINNSFVDNSYDIMGLANSSDEGINILSNEFENAIASVALYGPTQYNIKSNKFLSGSLGVLSESTEEYDNSINCNSFECPYGIFFLENNRHTQFRKNKFQTGQDVFMLNAKINTYQGSTDKASSNCFTNGGKHISTNSSDWFFYFAPPAATGQCYIPTNNLSDGGSNNYDFKDKYPHQKCEKGNKGEGENEHLSDEDVEIIRTRVPSFQYPYTYTETHIAQVAIGKKLGNRNWTEAATLIDNYPIVTQDDNLFVEIQRINLDRLRNEGNYELPYEDYNKLRNAALSSSPMSAYAKSLLLLLKGERFYPNIPEINTARGRNLAADRKDISKENNISLTPNPSTDYLKLTFNKKSIKNGTFMLIDLFGRVLHTEPITTLGFDEYTIDTSKLPEGLYIAKLVDGDSFYWENKIIIQRQ